MPQLIKDGAVIEDSWQLLDDSDCETGIPAGQVIIPLTVWQTLDKGCADLDRSDLGVCIPGDTDLAEFGHALAKLPVIAVQFPGFMDGRGFSSGRLLRERYHFTGELRATGHIIRDQFCYLRRCGFNALQPSGIEDLNAALASLNDFQEYYQSGVDQPTPLFRRRSA